MRNIIFALVIAAICGFFVSICSSDAHAKELGRTIFNGKTVQLNDDGTWKYVNPQNNNMNKGASNCLSSKLVPVQICPDPRYWKKANLPSSDYEYFFNNANGSLYWGMITEGVPLGRSFFKTSILDNAANVAKGGRDGVKIYKDTTVKIGSDTWNYLEYSINLNDMIFRYGNYYTGVGDKGSIQILFFTIDSAFDKYRPEMEKTIKSLKIML